MLLQLIFPHYELVKTIAKVSSEITPTPVDTYIFNIPPPQFLVFHHHPIVIPSQSIRSDDLVNYPFAVDKFYK